MKAKKAYDIAFVGLKNGIHHFYYHIGDEFFENYGALEFTNPDINVDLILDKKNGFFLLKFEVTGNVQVNCDRCGDPLTMDIWDEFDQVVKLVENPDIMNDDADPEVSYISQTASHLNVADWIYEFILLSLPLQRVHPEKSNGQPDCNPKVMEMLRQMQEKKESAANPIWKDLDQFKS